MPQQREREIERERQAIGWEEHGGGEEGSGFLLRRKTTPFCGVFFFEKKN
jgi:hypothetical protein